MARLLLHEVTPLIFLIGTIVGASASGLTFDDALVLALRESPTLAEAEASADAARAAVGVARAWSDPTVGVGTTRYSAHTTLTADWTLPRASYGSTLHAAAADRDRARAEQARTGGELRSQVSHYWIDLWAAEQRRTLAEASVTDARAVRDAAAARFEAGDAPRTELLAAQSALARAEAGATGSEAERRGASARLAALLGVDGDLETLGEPRTAPIGEIDALRGRLGDHPIRVTDAANVEAATARRRAATANWIPEVGVGVEIDVGDPGLPGTDVLAHVALSLPIGGQTSPLMAVAAAEERRAEARLQIDERALRGDLEAAWYAWDAARSRLAALDERALPAAVESADLAREAYAAGETDLLTVLTARTDELSTRADRIDALVALASARADLILAAGVTDVD